jgi:predicted peroxiredoxin
MTQESATPPRSLGICVTTRESARHVLGLAGAAARVGISTEIFLTGEGVHVVRERRFEELIEVARVSVCDASFRAAGLNGEDVVGLTDKDFVTQWRNAEMVEHCDRYLIV